MDQREEDLKIIRDIIKEKDAADVEEIAVQLIDVYPKDDEILKLLCQIFESDWHTRHEDMALGFQYIKNPIAMESLFNVAGSNFDYCAWDENYALQRKCAWALADIGTEEAKGYLKKMEQNKNPLVAAFATKRLENWDSEIGRKGGF